VRPLHLDCRMVTPFVFLGCFRSVMKCRIEQPPEYVRDGHPTGETPARLPWQRRALTDSCRSHSLQDARGQPIADGKPRGRADRRAPVGAADPPGRRETAAQPVAEDRPQGVGVGGGVVALLAVPPDATVADRGRPVPQQIVANAQLWEWCKCHCQGNIYDLTPCLSINTACDSILTASARQSDMLIGCTSNGQWVPWRFLDEDIV
jgi:hypothetical protein